MNLRTTIALLLLACGLVAVLLFTRERIEDPKAPTVPVFGGRSLKEAIRMRWRHGPTTALVELTREGDGPFRITEPIVDQVSRAFLVNLVNSYDAEPLREAFPGEKLTTEQISQLGFDEPRATFEAWFGDGKHVRIEIGRESPLGRDNYVRRDGVIYTGGIGLWSALNVNHNDLRERVVFANTRGTAAQLTVEQLVAGGAVERVRLVKKQNERWQLEEPRQSRTEVRESESFVAAVLSLRIDQFPPMPTQLPQRAPDFTITVDGSLGNETIKLWRDPSDSLIGEHLRRNLIFVSADRQYNEIFRNVAEQMRAKWLIPIDDLPKELTRVVIDQGGDRPRIVVSRQNPTAPFQLQEPVVSPYGATPLAELIQAVNNLRVIEYVEGKPDEARFGLAGEGMTLEVLGDKPPGTTLKFGADAAGEVRGIKVTYAQRRDEPNDVVAVPTAAVEILRRPWSVYPELKVLTLLPGAQVELVRVRGRDSSLVEYRRKDGRWQRVGSDAPADWVGNVVDETSDLRGISADMSRRLQLGDPDRTIDLCRGSGDEFASLLVWDRGKGQPLRARVKSKDVLVFELDELRSDYLRKLWQ